MTTYYVNGQQVSEKVWNAAVNATIHKNNNSFVGIDYDNKTEKLIIHGLTDKDLLATLKEIS